MKLADQTEIDIEIQVTSLPVWADRSLYYVSKMFTETIKTSEEYDVLKKCIGISVLDFNLWEDNSFYHTCFKIMETERHFLYTDKMEFHVIELKKVPKTVVDDNDAAYWWGCFINAKRKEEFEMLAQKNPNLEAAYEQLQRISADEIKRVEYQRREKEIRDKLTYIKFAKMEGLEEGRQKGLEEGREKEREEVAIKLLKKGFPPEDIVEVSNLSIERIKELKAKLKE